MEEMVKLGDVLDYEQPTKYIVESTDYSDTFKIPVLTAGKTFILGYTDENKGVFDNLPVIIFDDFTTAFHYVDFPFKVKSSAMKILKPAKEKADLKFLYYKMQTISMDTNLHKRYWISKYSQVEIPLPPLATQQKIAAILDAADELRQKDKTLVAKYDELTQALFLNMFGDPVTNPKGWEFKVLNDIINQKPDNGFFAKNNLYSTEGMPIVWLSDFIDRLYIKTTGLKRVLTTQRDEKYILKYGDALFCRSSLTVEGIGKCAIVPIETNEAIIFECHIIRLRFNLKVISPEFFRFLTNTKYFRGEVMKNAKTSTMTTISQEGISNIKIPLPNLKLQNQFAERVKAIEEQKSIAQASAIKSEELFNSLLQKAFNGELV